MSNRIVVGLVAAALIVGAAACTKSETPTPKPAAAPAAEAPKAAAPKAAPAEKPAMGGGEAKPEAPKPQPEADET